MKNIWLIIPKRGVAVLSADDALKLSEQILGILHDPSQSDEAVRLRQDVDWRDDTVTGVDVEAEA